ncbi:MAG TPA: hypothetical protein DCQ06_09085 [Myxococcales bacterium]|nr:hypothetical protein [Myxococcales bacterium]HAN31735.1 hypothetical protein [Myxococcales bacterium]
MEVLATAAEGTADLLAEECRELGLTIVHVRRDGVVLDLNTKATAKALVHLRIATRLLLAVDDCFSSDAEDLYRSIRQIDWRRWLDDRHTIAIHATGALPGSPEAPSRRGRAPRGPGIKNHVFAAQKAKDAICDQLRNRIGERPSVDLEDPDVRVVLRFRGDRCGVYLDISGEAMHRRGYRVDMVEAPLKETLAAAIVRAANWDGKCPLLDPMCGSGTLIIEAVMLHLGIAPGAMRDFAIERWPHHGQSLQALLEKEREQAQHDAKEAIANAQLPSVVAADFDRTALRATRTHLERVGLDKLVEVSRVNARRMDAPPAGTMIVTNPPYGERIGGKDVTDLYRDLSHHWAPFEDLDLHILDGHEGFIGAFGYQPVEELALRNGPLHVRLLHLRMDESFKLQDPPVANPTL